MYTFIHVLCLISLDVFFSRLILGIGKLRFKPAYNPYTEPSMEVFSYHDGKTNLFACTALTLALFTWLHE